MKKYRAKLSEYPDKLKSLYYRESCNIMGEVEKSSYITFCDGKAFTVKSEILIPVDVKKMTLIEYKEIAKKGDWIRTNGDLNSVMENGLSLEGQVGEISSCLDENSQKEKETLFIWQNKYEGENGKKKPIEKGFQYAWKVFLDNKDAYIEVITGKEDTEKCDCDYCNKTVDIFNIEKINKKEICISCAQEHFSFCSMCSSYVKKEKTKLNKNKIYCLDCYKNNIKICSKCGEAIEKNEIIESINTKKCFCKKCYEEEFIICTACKIEIPKNKPDSYKKGLDALFYCMVCFNVRFGTCRDCGGTFFHDDLIQNEENREWYCRTCWKRFSPIKEYNYQPNYQYLKLPWENKNTGSEKALFLGWELEINTPDKEIPEIVANKFSKFLKKEKLNTYLYLKHDTSVGQGFEIVSHPMTLQFIHKKLNPKLWLNWLKDNKCSSYDSGRCGLHVHVNKKFFRILDIAKLRLFFFSNWEQILAFSQRNGVHIEYCEKERLSINDILLHRQQEGRRWGLNLNTGDKNTIEVRIFRGTLRHERFIGTLQFIDAICSFVKEVGITFLIENKQTKNSWNRFLEWSQKSNRYDHLCKLIKRGKLK